MYTGVNNMTSQTLERLLKEGDRKTVGNVARIVDLCGDDAESFGALFEFLFHEESAVQMRAADAIVKLAKLYPLLLPPYKERILDEVTLLNHQEVNWHTAQLLGMLEFSKKEAAKAMAVLQKFLTSKSSILKTCALQGMCDIATKHPAYKKEVLQTITHATETGTPAMKARGRMLLKVLKG